MTHPDTASIPDASALRDLQLRLLEAEETLNAIRSGDVDAVVVGGPTGQQVYTLESADRPYRVLIERMQEGAVTLSPDGIILYANQRFAAIAGTTPEQLVGSLIYRFFSGRDGAALQEMLAGYQDGYGTGELTLDARNGLHVPVNVSLANLVAESGMPRVVCGVITDLTHSRRRSHELAAANARLGLEIEERRLAEDNLQLALDAADMGNWDLDLETGVILSSLRHDRIFGYPEGRADWTLAVALAHFLPEDRDEVAEALSRTRVEKSIEFENRIKRANDGAVRWLQFKGRTTSSNHTPSRIIGVVTDITDRRQIEEQLRQSQKMEAVGQLAGGLAHDFNNLLTGILGSLELLQIRVAQGRTSEADRYVSAAQGAAKRAAALTHRLLAFSRQQTLDPKPTDINHLVVEIEDLVRRTVGLGVDLQVVLADGLWRCLVDPNQLENALLNLVINGRDAMPEGGRLTVETANFALDAQSSGPLELPPGEYVMLSVTDTGIGMTPEVIARAFDPFFTTKPIGAGTGLGLSMIYGFARQSGGQVHISSQPGQGTIVRITLPRHSGQAQAIPDPVPEAGKPRAERGETILVVDDEPTVRMLVAETLDEFGYKAIEAADGLAGIAVLQSSTWIDLLITDVGLPGGMNGRQVAETARALRPDLKILFITGYAENEALHHEHLDIGMHVLTKPFSMEVLASRIAALIRG